jgi:hypothetical protein
VQFTNLIFFYSGLRKVAEEATKFCVPMVVSCVHADDLPLLLSSPKTVLTTDNSCQAEEIARLPQQMSDCQKGMEGMDGMEGMEEVEWVEGVVAFGERCDRIGQTVRKCLRETRVGCFSDRENAALAEVLETALVKAREVFAMDEVLEMLSARQSKLGKCALGSGEQSGGNTSTFFYICVALVCLHIVI